METRRIGSLEVSVVGLGCNNFGWRIDADASAAAVNAALDAGINFFDTADIYGAGQSEEFLGRALGARRSEALIATKFGMKMDEQRHGARPEYVRQAAEDSLRRLGTDRIDLYQLHQPDAQVPIAETLGALDGLVRAGKVREIGCSNFSGDQLRGRGGRAGRGRALRQRAEPIQPGGPRAGSGRDPGMRAVGHRVPALFPVGQWATHGQVSPRPAASRRQPRTGWFWSEGVHG